MSSAYDKKFDEMKKYIPFLESMIQRLEASPESVNPRQAQLDKIRSLRDLLLDKNKRMKMENLRKCEQVLVNLYAKVEQRDPFSNTKPTEKEVPASKEKSELETVRKKLKSVVKLQDSVETLPEIARANDVESQYTGSKEPALFQRRPNKKSNSPINSKQNTVNESKASLAQQRRNYTRVLISPDRSNRRWSSSERPLHEPLFSRRSPQPIPPSPPKFSKKEKKKSKAKSRKTKNVNITLNVPQESLKTLNTEDIFARILNCTDGDVDIDTLRELRTQILGELKQTGKNDDISNLILQSYKKSQKKKVSKDAKKDVEEGELSDSESEAIESIYGSLSVVDKDKINKSLTQVKTVGDKDNQHQKIQICLVINTDKGISNATENTSKPSTIIDLSELEMFSDSDADKSKEIISVDSSPAKKGPIDETNSEVVKDKSKIDMSLITNSNSPKNTECITVDDENENVDETAVPSSDDLNINSTTTNSPDICPAKDSAKNNIVTTNKPDSEQKQSPEVEQKNVEQPLKFIANFYKPIEEQLVMSDNSKTISNKISEQPDASEENNDNLSVQATCSKDTNILSVNEKAGESETPFVGSVNKTATNKEPVSLGNEKQDESQIIPLLNEPTIPPKAKTDMLSEIDILQALKNEILSETITMPGTEAVTPALHQPKLTKVASAQEVMSKKRISIEKYKAKTATSTPKSLFIKRRSKAYREEINKKQSLKLTEKECERFNFPKRLSLDDDDDDIDDISDDNFSTEDKDDTFVLGDIYGDLAPKSPENQISNECSTPPVIIPVDPVKAPVVSSKSDVDMRALLPTVSQSHPTQPVAPPPIQSLLYAAAMPSSPAYSVERNMSNIHHVETSNTVADINRMSAVDPRFRRDNKLSAVNSPNSYITANPERTPRSTPFSNVVPNAPNITPNMVLNITPNMTSSYMPNIPLLMTPNARTFEMTPTHQTFELDESATRQHVYAPSFSLTENKEKEPSISRDGTRWDMDKSETRSRRSRWEESNIPSRGTTWDRDPRSNSGQNDGSSTPRYDDSYAPKYDKYNEYIRTDKYKHDRRDSSAYSTADCPMTPVPSFGWSECPPTPGSAFGWQEAPMTPIHPFGRSDCPATPIHPFGRIECPPTPSSGFGRNVDMTSNHSYIRSECPSTPSHSFGRSDCPQTPSHPFGRSESIPYVRPEVSNGSSQKYSKDPRLNRRQTEYELSSQSNRDLDFTSDRGRKSTSYKSHDRSHYSGSDSSRNYERNRSVGRTERNNRDRHDRDRREVSRGRSVSKDVENERLYTRNRESRYNSSKDYDDLKSRHNQRERSVNRPSNSKQTLESTRAPSVGRSTSKEPNKDSISFQSDTGKNFTIDTSVKSSFQDFLPSGKPIQVFEYSFDVRRQRAASVGRSLMRESSVGRTLSEIKTSTTSNYSKNRNDKFKRASSVGRDTGNINRSLKEIKAAFQKYLPKNTVKKTDTNIASDTDITRQYSPRDRNYYKSKYEDQKRVQSNTQYYPRKNNRDPRMRKEESMEFKSRYKIDRRSDLHNHKKSGIIYSNDNIAKGTILGSGFGVRNYKIPKIKRAEPKPEVPEVKEINNKKSKDKVIIGSAEKGEIKKDLKDNDKKSKSKLIEESAKPAENTKSKIRNESKTSSSTDYQDERQTRSMKKLDKTDSKTVDEDVVIKTRKYKKPVIYDTDSDSAPEKEVINKSSKGPDLSHISSNKNVNDSKTTSPTPALDKKLQKKPTEGSLDSAFGIDDMEIFSENLAPDPVIESINNLIADLDQDLDTSKTSNGSYAVEMENILDIIDSPEGDSFRDISEVIEKDLNESHDNLQQKLIAEDLLKEKREIAEDLKLAGKNLENSHNANQEFEVCKNLNIEKFTNPNTSVNDLDIAVETGVAIINEDFVSTTAIDPTVDKNDKLKADANDIANKSQQLIPDSTIKKNGSSKTLPDSTNEIQHCELSSDVTSTFDTGEPPHKESEIQSTTQKETFNSIGNLLSILQDKSKIKQLLSMLGEQSHLVDKDKIKKKLEKLREIVSDEDENEELVHLDAQKIRNEENTGVICTDKNETSDKTEKIDAQEKSEDKNNDESVKILQELEIDKTFDITEKSVESEATFNDNLGNNQDNSETLHQTHEKVLDGKNPKEFANVNLNHSEDEDKNTEEITNSKSKNKVEIQNTHKADKLGSEDGSDGEDNEPLVKQVRKKIKRKKSIGKSKSAPNKTVNKRITRATPAKTGVKKRGELQKLQEDIKEMFMSDDILNATGIRMCRLAKMVSEKDSSDSGPVVVLEKVKGMTKNDQLVKMRKKPGPKPKNKVIEKTSKSLEDTKIIQHKKTAPKYKPGPKSKKKSEDTDPYDFDTDSFADTSVTKESDDDSSDSETGSLASSRSFGSNEVLADTKKKPKRKRRGIGGWQSGIIKPKNKKKKEQKQQSLKPDSSVVKSQRPVTIPDPNCFTDKSYCFQKGVTTYDCRLCVYSGSDIVKHYKNQHPHTEIPLSRMDQKTAELAILQCGQKDFLALGKISSDKYTCRFCNEEFSNNRMVLERFFWHVVSHHTGEFNYLCPECVNVTRCPFNLDIPPPPKDGGQLIGYICKKCNFTQISLENLKTHVIEHHSDEQTEVFTINLAVMSNKAMKAMLRRARSEKPRVVRSLRSNHSAADTSEMRDDSSDAASSRRSSECDTSQTTSKISEEQEAEVSEQKPKIDKMKAKLTFENDEPSDDISVKMEHEDNESLHFEDPHNSEVEANKSQEDSRRGNSDDIMDYPHFKLNYTDSGAKEYICCINGSDRHYKTSLLISMKKHIQTKHSEKWDGYCCLCKVIVTLQGVTSDFRECLAHFLDKHIDDFPILEKTTETPKDTREIVRSPESNLPASILDISISVASAVASASPLPAAALSPSIPARVATPPVDRTASPSYLAVRPIAELLSKELMKKVEVPIEIETPITLPKIGNVISLGVERVPPAQASPVYPVSAEPAPQPAKPFLYEDVQAEVMSNKHRVVLESMMSKENLVRVFKCAGRFCSFTTDSVDDALLHATTHQRVGGEGALNCAYCNYDAGDNGIDLVMHVFKEHSRCQFCCPKCFYRAAASQLVDVHYTKAHGGTMKNALRSTASISSVGPAPASSLLTRDVAVQHFVCNHDEGNCNFKTYTPGKYIEHLLQKHSTATSHPCNLCPTAPPSPAELVLHLRSHGLKLYQCTWCIHGANNETELLGHVATNHPNKQPQAYVRIITNKDGGMRVLPLANLNKSKVTSEDVAPNTTKEHPVKEAERSIDLEKLIGHTMMAIEASTTQCAEDSEAEEAVEIPSESLPEAHDDDDDESTALDTLLTTTIPSEKGPEPITEPTENSNANESTKETAVVKTEPPEVVKNVTNSEIICLDSDEDSDTGADDVQNDDSLRSSVTDVVTAKKVSREVSRSSVTNEVSITKITEDSARTSTEEPNINRHVENIIDLSDDEPALSTPAPKSSGTLKVRRIIERESMFKCPGCFQIRKSAMSLKTHIHSHCPTPVHANIKCPHAPCPAIVATTTKLIAHFAEAHRKINPKVHSCGICSATFTSVVGAKLHIRGAHKVLNYEVALTTDATGVRSMTVQQAPSQREPTRISGRKTSTEIQRYQAEPAGTRTRKTSTDLKKRYGIDDIDKLPISPILDTMVFCKLCEFGTKVKLNLVRHLLQHSEKVAVPRTAPVNPVPHLETNEMHFDKMVNLASSSAATRAADKPRSDEPSVTIKIPPAESSRYPRYVPERVRYTCGAKDCSYISVDMAMFRCHWETLHARGEEYRCVHCPSTQMLDTSVPLSAARILAHLRMHDVCLYACSLCSYYHYRKQSVEKHLSEIHKDGTMKVVREEYQAEPATVAPSAGAPTMDLKAWQCGLCNFSSMLRPNVVNHCGSEHQSKMQFKCAYCPFRTSAKENVVKHQNNAHPTKAEEVFYYFYREGSIPDEPDGVPRWQMQRKKLGLDEQVLKTEPEPTESVPETDLSITPVATPAAIDLNIVKEEKPEEADPDIELSLEELCKKFGGFCEPDGIKYKCCLCGVVRELTRDAMRSHLYEELNYRRWECVICSYKAFHKTGLNDHMSSEHSRQFTPPRPLPTDVNIETWVQGILDHQAKAIESNLSNLSVQKIQGERVTLTPTVQKPPEPAMPTQQVSDTDLKDTFGEFGAPMNQKYSCPKCDFLTKDEEDMVNHLESELSKIRWVCPVCKMKFTSFHTAQFHCKSTHTAPIQPVECSRNPSLRAQWVTAVVAAQKQFIKCISETSREFTPDRCSEEGDQNENSLLVAVYDEPVNLDELTSGPLKRPPPAADSDDERLVIDEPPTKRMNDRKCPYCDYVMHNTRYVREHILKEHYHMKPYKCSYCSYEGSRPGIASHLSMVHYNLPKKFITVEVPKALPEEFARTSQRYALHTDVEYVNTYKRDAKESEEVAKKVCLYCEKSVPETEIESHSHGPEKVEFAKRGEVVVKCCKCLVLRLSVSSLLEHFDACHPGDQVLENYAYFKLQIDTREIYCCGHCYKKFKFIRDLKVHHSASHTSLSLSYTSIPFSHNLHTEGDTEIGKRKLDDGAGPSTKRVARKSTSKLPNSMVAKKSTTKLPYSEDEYSYYGTKPVPLNDYKNVKAFVNMHDSEVEIDVNKLGSYIQINPKVIVKDCKS